MSIEEFKFDHYGSSVSIQVDTSPDNFQLELDPGPDSFYSVVEFFSKMEPDEQRTVLLSAALLAAKFPDASIAQLLDTAIVFERG